MDCLVRGTKLSAPTVLVYFNTNQTDKIIQVFFTKQQWLTGMLHCFMWSVITEPTIEVSAWVSNYIPEFLWHNDLSVP